MSNRTEASGDQRAIASKLAARYDTEVESEVIRWFKELIGEDLKPGMRELEKSLRNGQSLMKLGGKVQEGTPGCPEKAKKMKMKPNTLDAPFKQMENIQTFCTFCENYGVPKTSLFQTVDLYEGRNMAQVISCIQQLGTECQRNGFKGPVIGPKPTEKNVREWTEEQLRAGDGMIGLQAGSNKGATQSGMGSGVRHIADIKVDEMSKEGAGIIGLQAGSNKGATQSGMGSGVRHIADIKVDDMSKEGAGIIGLQAGSNKGATQSGMGSGVRHIADIKVDAASKESQGMIGLQMGTNEGANQSGLSMGGRRNIN